MKKDSFVLYKSLYEPIKALSTEEKGVFLDAIFKYQLDGTIDNSMNPMVRMAFLFFKNQFDLDAKKYEDTCNKRAEIGRKGGLAKASKSYQKVAKGSKPSKSYHNDNDNDNDNDNEKDNDKEEKNFNIGSDEPKKPKGTGKRKKIKYSEEFEIFWKQWYSIADRPTESKESAFNEFKKLDIEEQRIAYKNIKPYSESLDDKKYMKHCCRYLKSGIFLNKFFSTTSQNIDHAFELKKEQARKDMLEAFENVG